MAKGMEIKNVNISDIKPYAKNQKKHPKEQVKNIATSIKKYGFIQPVVLDSNNEIIIGHGRVLASKQIKLDSVPCVYAENLTEEQIRELRIIDNKLNESEWDFDLLMDDLIDLDFSDFDIDFGIDELEEDDDKETEVQEDDYEGTLPTEPKAKLGDIYQLGNHRLMCGDSTSVDDVNKLMNGVKADMVLSDPPYGMFLDTDFSGIKGSMKSIGRKNHTQGNKYDRVIGDNEDFTPELITTFFDNFSYCKEIFLFGADYFAEILPNKNEGSWLVWDKRKESQADAIGSEFELCWSKQKHKRRMLRHDWFGFLSSQNGADARNRVHPTQKPITLLVDIIKQWGKDCEIIVDIYGGSGSTLIACEQLNRKCYMMELDPKYIDVIIDRWERFTGEKAVLINGER